MALVRLCGEDVAAALGKVASNALFRLECGLPDEAEADGWSRAVGLCRHGDATLAKLVGAVGAGAGAQERRVAGSLMVMGYSTRLVAPSVAVLLRKGLVLDLKPEAVWWRYRAGDGFRLRLPAPAGWRRNDGSDGRNDGSDVELLFERWCRVLVDGHLGPVVAAVRRVAPVAERLLWGNVASSLAGSIRTMALDGVVPLDGCLAACETLLDYGALAGAGAVAVRGGQLFFVRYSCCLYYRLPGGGLCGDCALLDQAERERQWAHAVAVAPGT